MSRTLTALLVVACGLLGVACSSDDSESSTTDVELLFVVRGAGTVTDDVLQVEAPVVDWFTASPERRAGREEASVLAAQWDEAFADDPPNAALTGDGGVDAELTLRSAEQVSGEIRFDTSVIRGDLPTGSLGEVELFVDPEEVTLPCAKHPLWCES